MRETFRFAKLLALNLCFFFVLSSSNCAMASVLASSCCLRLPIPSSVGINPAAMFSVADVL